MGKKEAKEDSSFQRSLELLSKEEKNDNAEMSPDIVMKRKSPKKRVKTEDVPRKEDKKTNDTVKIEGVAYLPVILETFILNLANKI